MSGFNIIYKKVFFYMDEEVNVGEGKTAMSCSLWRNQAKYQVLNIRF